ncbi:MAG: FecR domain-containing protein [Lachnospiraceae bacterium]|nr:FecR domain-containing protein [Lachnospiraceae bacterium]
MEEKKKLPLGAIIGAVCAVAVIVVLVVIFALKGKDKSYRTIKVQEVSGSATVERRKDGKMDAFYGMALYSEDKAYTEIASNLYLKLDEDKYIALMESTEIRINATGKEPDTKTKIELIKGTILNTIKNKLSENATYEVNTPNAVMAVRGTIFEVEIVNNTPGDIRSRVSVTEGVVAVTPLDANGNPAGAEVLVNAGEEIYVVTDANGVRIEDALNADISANEGGNDETPGPEGGQQEKTGYNETASNNATEFLTPVEIPDNESKGFAFAGLIPIKRDGKWGMADYNGNLIVPCEYDNFNSPSLSGYFVMRNENQAYIFDPQGNLVNTVSGNISASKDGYVTAEWYLVDDGDEYDDYGTIYTFYDYNGNQINRIESGPVYWDQPINDTAKGFYNGKSIVTGNVKDAYYYRDNIWVGVVPYNFGFVGTDGSVTWVDADGVNEEDTSLFMDPEESKAAQDAEKEGNSSAGSMISWGEEIEYPLSTLNRGYFLTQGQHITGLYIRDESGKLLSALDIWGMELDGEALVYQVDSMDGMGRSIPSYYGTGDNWDAVLKGYYYDGSYHYNYGSKILFTVGDKYVLADLAGGDFTYKIFDHLAMSEEAYWLCSKDGKWGYCDTEGNIVKMFDDASAFVNGKAFVVEGDTVYLIDSSFTKICEVGNVDTSNGGVVASGELLGIIEGDTTSYFLPSK